MDHGGDDGGPPRIESRTTDRLLADLRTAFTFLTRLPIGGGPSGRPLADAAWAFPVVGAAVGAIGALAAMAASALGLPPLLCGVLAVAATVLATGALHEDGLADTADGLGARGDSAERLAVMRDSRTGTFGVLAVCFGILVRAAAIAALPPMALLACLMAAHASARGLLVPVMRALPRASTTGLAAAAGRPPQNAVTASLALSAAALWFALPLGGALAALALICALAWLAGSLAQRKIGGYNGDILGAIEQVLEAAVLLVAVAWLGGVA